ncbi:MAG: MFS transporter [Methanoregula sp.]|jgi:MFS family permease
MKAYLPVLCTGIFAVMALSNAIVPVLPAFADESSWEGAIYSAYFFGAFLLTLAGGILSDRYGRLPIIRAGLVITVVSGFFLFYTTGPLAVVILRFIEGLGAGLFVAAGMSYVNSQPDHTKLSGYYLAMLNIGLVLGLVTAGWLAVRFEPESGIGFFTLLSFAALAASLFIREPAGGSGSKPMLNPQEIKSPPVKGHDEQQFSTIKNLAGSYFWLWYSTIVLVGITGVLSSLYPKYTGEAADVTSLWIAGMSVATIVTVLIVSRISLPAVGTIRWSAVLMAAGVLLAYVSPAGFIVLGILAGVVMIAQMAVLAKVKRHQGLVMGLFSTSSYLGMSLLPFIAGIVTEISGFYAAFMVTALFGLTVAVSIGRCSPCRGAVE